MKHDVLSLFIGDHIAIIGQKGIPAEFVGTSGIEFYVEERAIKLVKKNKKVICYVRPWATPPSMKIYKGIHLVNLPTINTKHFDAITHSFLSTLHACFSSADTIWFQAIGPAVFCPLAKLSNKKVIVTIHGLDWKRDKWNGLARSFIYFCEQVLVRFADEILIVSPELQQYYTSQYGRSTVIDAPIIKKRKPIPPDIITKKYGLKGNDYILYMGRFVPEKRIEWIIEAYQKLKKKNLKLILSGDSSHSNTYTNKLKQLSSNNKKIIFTGYVFGRGKEELLSNSKTFILASKIEGNPISLHEAIKYNRTLLVPKYLSGNLKCENALFFDSDSQKNFELIFQSLI